MKRNAHSLWVGKGKGFPKFDDPVGWSVGFSTTVRHGGPALLAASFDDSGPTVPILRIPSASFPTVGTECSDTKGRIRSMPASVACRTIRSIFWPLGRHLTEDDRRNRSAGTRLWFPNGFPGPIDPFFPEYLAFHAGGTDGTDANPNFLARGEGCGKRIPLSEPQHPAQVAVVLPRQTDPSLRIRGKG